MHNKLAVCLYCRMPHVFKLNRFTFGFSFSFSLRLKATEVFEYSFCVLGIKGVCMRVSPLVLKPRASSLLAFIVSCLSVFLAEGTLYEDGNWIVFPAI